MGTPSYLQKKGMLSRWTVLEMLGAVLIRKKTLSDIKHGKVTFFHNLPPEQKARSLSLLESVLRNRSGIDEIIYKFVEKNTDVRVINILRIATAEILVDGVAVHAAVDSAVQLVKSEKKTDRYKGLVNAVCRKIAKKFTDQKPLLTPNLNESLFITLEHIYGHDIVKKFGVAQVNRPPLDITLKDEKLAKHYAQILNAKILSSGSLRIDSKTQVSRLSGFNEGVWWVQDFSAALPVRLLGDVKGAQVLDVCAAPGGKTMQLASLGAEVTAVEISKRRAQKLKENLIRTNLKARIVLQDILNYNPNEKFDFVIVDPPCSSTGTIRRNFELQYLSPLERLPFLVDQQKSILKKTMNLLKEGGTLIYCTCSLLPEEGEKIIEEVIRKAIGWIQIPIDTKELGIDHKWLDSFGGLRLRPDYWPEIGGMDGFYIASLTKRSKTKSERKE